MKLSQVLFCAVVGLAVLYSVSRGSQPVANAQPTTWEHLAMTVDVTGGAEVSRKITELGSKGWELVDVEGIAEGGTTKKLTYCFKRPQ